MFTTNQQVLDHVCDFLVKQGRASYGELPSDPAQPPSGSTNRSCLYNGPDGTACAAGCLLGPEKRADLTENLTVTNLISEGAFRSVLGPDISPRLIQDLQWAHDGAADTPDDFLSEFKKGAQVVAVRFGLQIPESIK